MPDKMKVLICDDEPAILEALKTELLAEGYDVIAASSGEEAIELFKKESPNLVILDIMMPGMTGFEVFNKMKTIFGDKYMPVIFLSASVKIDDKLRALHSGAVDYLVKPVSFDELLARVQNFLKYKQKHDKLKEEATFDWMTGTLNKVHFLIRAQEEIEKAARNKVPIVFILIDIDKFKAINDTLGHLAGDRVLYDFADILKRFVRKVDLIGRFGGDEFMIMLSHKTEKEAGVVIDRLRKALQKPIVFEKNKINVTFSAGIVLAKEEKNPDINKLFKDSDQALYKAKSKGGNCCVIK